MAINLIKLSAFIALTFLFGVREADSFLLSESNKHEVQYADNKNSDFIIPLIYIENMQYYNKTETAAYTTYISEYLALEPNVIVTDDEKVADYNLVPKLLKSKLETLSETSFRYSLSISLELWTQGGIKATSVKQNRYIIIEKTQNVQLVARQLLKKLLREALNNLAIKIRNNQLNAG